LDLRWKNYRLPGQVDSKMRALSLAPATTASLFCARQENFRKLQREQYSSDQIISLNVRSWPAADFRLDHLSPIPDADT
jgi:hypothetical protein